MSWRNKSKVRTAAQKLGYKSGFEAKIAEQLDSHKLQAKELYEKTVIKYTVPARDSRYTVDWTLPNGILIESKGRWTAEDRKKHLLVKQQHPELDIRIIFQSAKNKISKGSKTTYADFCNKHGIVWAEKIVPENWYVETSKIAPTETLLRKSWFSS
jgi:hypothetical protein